MKLIKKLQKKPRSFRLLILWLATAFVMLIIVFIWLFSFSRNFSSQEIETEAKDTKIPSLFESIKKDFSDLKENISASLKKIDDIDIEQLEQEYGEEE